MDKLIADIDENLTVDHIMKLVKMCESVMTKGFSEGKRVLLVGFPTPNSFLSWLKHDTLQNVNVVTLYWNEWDKMCNEKISKHEHVLIAAKKDSNQMVIIPHSDSIIFSVSSLRLQD
jgi:hypothetical protein